MQAARAFQLAADQPRTTATALDYAQRAINAMARTDARSRAQASLPAVREMCDEFTRLTLGLGVLSVTYRPDMTEGELRQWAEAVVEEMTR